MLTACYKPRPSQFQSKSCNLFPNLRNSDSQRSIIAYTGAVSILRTQRYGAP
jgi:hypothetical protein